MNMNVFFGSSRKAVKAYPFDVMFDVVAVADITGCNTMIGEGFTVMITDADAVTPTASTMVSVIVKFPVSAKVKLLPD